MPRHVAWRCARCCLYSPIMIRLLAGAAAALLFPSVITDTVRGSVPHHNPLGRLPLQFEANRGQVDPSVLFFTHTDTYTMSFTQQDAVIRSNAGALRLRLAGAHPRAIEGLDPLAGKTNYFFGKDPRNWQTNVPQFGKVRYRQVYSGIDAVYYGNQQNLEYDFVLSPGAHPESIRLQFEGARSLHLSPDGDLVIDAPGGEIRQHKPIIYQASENGRRQVEGGYVLTSPDSAGFTLGEYDSQQELIIDPTLTYSTYLGGSGDETSKGIALDAAGNIYIAGRTSSARFLVDAISRNAYQGGIDAFVAKLNPAGTSILYLTFFGGAGIDAARAIAVDSAGNAYVAGETTSTDFPTVNGFQNDVKGRDAFVLKLNASGDHLDYGTCLGGDGLEVAYAIAIDSAGSAYVGGVTESTNFPLKGATISSALSGPEDVFVSKLSPAGSALIYSTYMGGLGGEYVNGIAVDSTGAAYITGITGSNAFPTVNAVQRTRPGGLDGFVSKLNPAGSALVFSTFIGGAGDDEGDAIALDAAGNVYVAGTTNSSNFPLVNAFQPNKGGASVDKDAFVLKLNASGGTILYSTFLGGSAAEQATGIAVDSAGNAYVTGYTQSNDFPTIGALQPTRGQDAFLARYSPSGTLAFSTPLGGNGADLASAITLDTQANVYLTGNTDSADFPLKGAVQGTYAGGAAGLGDAFIAKINLGGLSAGGLSVVSAASFSGDTVAPDSIVAAFGQGLATDLFIPNAGDFPTTLGGVSIKATDSAGIDRLAQLYFVSQGQINFVMPGGMAPGLAQVTELSNGQPLASGSVKIATVAPSIFTADSSGKGPAAAVWLRVAADGTQTSGLTFACQSNGTCTTVPIDLGAASDQVILLLFGTGIRGRSNAGASATMGDQSATVLGAQAQGQYPGFDQANIRIPRQLIGRGEVNVVLNVDGQAANVVKINIGGTPPPLPPAISSLNPTSGSQGQTIATFSISGQNLAGVTSVDFSPAADIAVTNINAAATSVTAQVSIGASATIGNRSVTVSSLAGRSNALNFNIQTAPPPNTGPYLPVKTGLAWDYRVTFTDTVQLPYVPIVEQPQGLLCASIFCGTKQFTSGQINFRITVNESLGTINGGESFRATITDPGGSFYFARTDPVEMRVRPVGGLLQLELIDTPSGFRLVRPLAAPTAAELAQKTTVTVPAGTYTDVVKTTLTLNGDGVYVQGTYTTDVYLASGVGLIRAVMHDSTGKTLFTEELTNFTQPVTGFVISNLQAGPSTNQTDGVHLPVTVDFVDSSGLGIAADGSIVVNFSILNGNLQGFETVKATGASAGATSGTLQLPLFLSGVKFSGSLSIGLSLKNSRGVTSNTLSGFFDAK